MASTSKSPFKHNHTVVTRQKPRSLACGECQRQKIKCSKERPSCQRCRTKSSACVYEESKKVWVRESKLRCLKDKIKQYEDVINSLPPEVLSSLPPSGLSRPSTVDPSINANGTMSEEEDMSDDSLPDQFQQLSIYLRSSRGSADNFFRTARTVSGLGGDDYKLDDGRSLYDAQPLPSRRQVAKEDFRLPPIDIARKYFAAQHMYIGTIFFFSDRETFEKQLREAYEGPPDIRDTRACLMYAKTLLILAFGQLYSVNRRNNAGADNQRSDDPPGFKYFAYALAWLPDLHEEVSIIGVETLAYAGYFMQNMNRRDAAFLYIGVALRMAISLGLHQELPTSTSLSDAASEYRRRVWWSIYSLDRILSLKSGNPIAILDEDITVNIPCPMPGEIDSGPVLVLRHYTELSRILGQITTLIYRRASHTAHSLISAVHLILHSLSQWEQALPDGLRLTPSKGIFSRESISVHLHYYQCINMTARPLLFHVVQKRLASIRDAGPLGHIERQRDWRSDLSKKTASVISACISAAHNTVAAMVAAAEHDMVATFGYMDSEHVFSAAIVLVLVCGSFPSEPNNTKAMNDALALLKRMGDMGNGLASRRYQLLSHLQYILVPPSTMELNGSLTLVPNFVGHPTSPSGTLELDGVRPPLLIGKGKGSASELLVGSPQRNAHIGGVSAFGDEQLDLGLDDFVTAGLHPSSSMNQLSEADSQMWTTAFAIPGGIDISQLVPETDMNEYMWL